MIVPCVVTLPSGELREAGCRAG